jgi:DNA-binding beta-propeller fold protein YncE
MRKPFALLILMMPLLLLVSGCSENSAPVENTFDDQQLEKSDGHFGNNGNIVVANRNSGSISVINTKTDEVSGTYQLPAGPNTPEPMYVVFVKQGHCVLVGDRANNQVVVFNSFNYNVETTIPVGQGVFHMWADPQGRQLWVNNDIDNTTSMINLHSMQVIATVPTPPNLVSMGGKPHDVILGPFGKHAYVTVVGVTGSSDYVVQYSTTTFQETGRAAVGKDAHVSLTTRNHYLYVPCQNSDAVYVLNRFNMNQVEIISVIGAHGVNITTSGKVLYTTNLPGGGPDGLFAIGTRNNSVIGTSNTPYAVPHNIALTPNSKKLYLTHSGGTSDKVTVYTISNHNPVPQFLKEITVELNPFGLAYAK